MNEQLVEWLAEGEEAFGMLVRGKHVKPQSLAKAMAWAAIYPDAASGYSVRWELDNATPQE